MKTLHALVLLAALAVPASAYAQQATQPASVPGRLLASNCFQCHGTNGRGSNTFERLAGKSASEIYKELREMKAEREFDDIMTFHAVGYTDAQLRLIADYFSRQTR